MTAPHTAFVSADLAHRAYARSSAQRWGVAEDDFTAALQRSVSRRFTDHPPDTAAMTAYLDSLSLDDLALARACALGREAAWEHFVREYRPILLRMASRQAPPDVAREIADSLYADLFGMDERDGARRSLFDYFHGRSALASWLRAVIGQRIVDHARVARRFDPLPEADEPGELAAPTAQNEPDPDRDRLLPLVQRATRDALVALEAGDRLRLALYYGQGLRMAAIGKAVGESEATVSRKLDRVRKALRCAIEARLREQDRLSEAEIREGLAYAHSDPALDLQEWGPAP